MTDMASGNIKTAEEHSGCIVNRDKQDSTESAESTDSSVDAQSGEEPMLFCPFAAYGWSH